MTPVDARPVGSFRSSQRVRKRSEFQEIQTSGRRVPTPHFVLLVRVRGPTQETDRARVGLTVSRKVGNAVVRNRAKRLLREAFRATRDLWDPDVDLVVIVKQVTPGLKLCDVVDEWRRVAHVIRRRTADARRDREKRERALAHGA